MKSNLLIIVAGDNQVPIFEAAKRRDCFIIACDLTDERPAYYLADEIFLSDTYDKEAILDFVKDKNIDGALTFISTHGLESVSYVCSHLKLVGINNLALDIVLSKSNFRSFLQENNFSVPLFKWFKLQNIEEALEYAKDLSKKVNEIIIKPTKNSANRGISKLSKYSDNSSFSKAINFAFENSPENCILIEEFIKSAIRINGDGIIVDNEICYSLIGDYFYDKDLNDILPYATVFPSKYLTVQIIQEIERLFKCLNYGTGVFNFEAIIRDGKIFFIEINPRHSGNFIYKLMSKDTGVRIEDINVDLALGNVKTALSLTSSGKYLAYCALYSDISGIIDKIIISDELNQYIFNQKNLYNSGDFIHRYNLTSDKLVLLHLEFPNENIMFQVVNNIKQYYTVKMR